MAFVDVAVACLHMGVPCPDPKLSPTHSTLTCPAALSLVPRSRRLSSSLHATILNCGTGTSYSSSPSVSGCRTHLRASRTLAQRCVRAVGAVSAAAMVNDGACARVVNQHMQSTRAVDVPVHNSIGVADSVHHLLNRGVAVLCQATEWTSAYSGEKTSGGLTLSDGTALPYMFICGVSTSGDDGKCHWAADTPPSACTRCVVVDEAGSALCRHVCTTTSACALV